MLYELRTYLIPEGRMDDILKRFRTVTMKLFKKHHMEVIGFWTTDNPAEHYALVYLMRYPDRQAMDESWTAFRADPEWIAARKRTEANGPIVTEAISQHLLPTDFSPLK